VNKMLIRNILKFFPELKVNLKKSRMKQNASTYLKRTLLLTLLIVVVCLGFFISFVNMKLGTIIILFIVSYFIVFVYVMKMPIVYAKRKERDINQNLLFLTRYLLIKVESGVPLYNALESASKKFKYTGKVIQEIIREINLGTPMESAIESAIDYCASENFSRLLWEILNALKTGVDISTALKATITDLTKQHSVEIERYSKKLNSLTMFYMLIAIVLPSLGTTMFVIITGFMNLEINLNFLMIIAFFLVVIQFMFMSLFRSIRPMVEL